MSELTAAAIEEIERLTSNATELQYHEPFDDLLLVKSRDDESVIQFDLEAFRPRPRRRTGAVALTDGPSLTEYVARYRNNVETTLWADRDKLRVTAVLNDHPAGIPADAVNAGAWGDHRATLQLKFDPDWLAWIGADGKLYDQEMFADLLEQNAQTVSEAALLYEIATSLRAHKSADFTQALNVGNGEVKLRYEETITAKAGQKGELDIPQVFVITAPVFEGHEAVSITARLVYRLNGGDLRLGIRLLRPHIAVRQAFTDIALAIAGTLDLPILAGSPRG